MAGTEEALRDEPNLSFSLLFYLISADYLLALVRSKSMFGFFN